MKKLFRVLSIVLLLLIACIFIFYLIKNERLPEGQRGPRADEMATKMMEALNKMAWDSTEHVKWTFKEIHHYDWNRIEHSVIVRWDEIELELYPETISGKIIKAPAHLAKNPDELLKKAWDFFNNDSFWLYAPFKVFDPGTERSLVKLKDGREGLMVTYNSGGSTPGDSYVWFLDEFNRPTSVKMWVSILPLGGMEFTWENYLTLESGAMIAQDHWVYGSVNVALTDVK